MTSATKLSGGNVIPFVRPRSLEQAPEVMPPRDVARAPAIDVIRDRVRLAAFVVLSLAFHAGLLAAAWREPVPLASIGLEVISVEITIGATAPAGVATTPGQNQVQSAPAPDEKATEPEQTEQKATEQPQSVEVAKQDTAAEQKNEPKARGEPTPAIAMIESPAPDIATAAPREMSPPEPNEITLLPQPAEKPVENKPTARAIQTAPPKPVQNAAPAEKQRRIAAPTREKAAREAKASTPSSQASNVGVGRSDHDTNYAGLVSAHLRRHQQYPSDARSRGDQGTATVTFSLDGGGRVTTARLARGSGIASLDQEVQAMVRRASPFPAPPSRQSVSFTVPVSFRLN